MKRVIVALIATAALSMGCASAQMGVEPWERDLLSSSAMQLDSNSARDGNDAHLYFSREASSGGAGFGGGGCGCN